MAPLPFLLDENVADQVGTVLTEFGHDVVLVRDSLGRRSPDQLLAVAADRHGLIIVTHDKDLRRFSRLLPEGSRRRFRAGAGALLLACPEPDAARRIREMIDVIEFHHERARRAGGRLYMRITKTGFNVSDPLPDDGEARGPADEDSEP